VAAIPAALAFVWLSERRNWVIAALLLVGISLPFIAPEPARERVKYTLEQGRDQRDVVEVGGVKLDTSLSARLRSYRAASEDWVEHPVLGYGVTGYKFLDLQYLRVITETGLVGLITFLFLVSTIFRQGYRAFKGTTDIFYRGLTMGYLAGFVGLLCHALGANTFIIVRIMEPFWFLTAMVIVIPELEKQA
jgi:O-antigen ligase